MTWLPVKAPRLPSAAASPSVMRSMSVAAAARRAQCVDRDALVGGGQLVDERMLGGHDRIGHAEAGVGPGGEDP